MFYILSQLLLVAIIVLGLLFLFNNRFQMMIKSMFNKGMSNVEDQDALLDQAALNTRKQDAQINASQAKTIAMYNGLESERKTLTAKIADGMTSAKIFKDKFVADPTDTKSQDMAIRIIESLTDEQMRLEALDTQLSTLKPAFENASKMATMARENNEQARAKIENTRMEVAASQATKQIAESMATFDPNKVDTSTDAIIRNAKQNAQENNAKLGVAMEANKGAMLDSEVANALKANKAKVTFDNL